MASVLLFYLHHGGFYLNHVCITTHTCLSVVSSSYVCLLAMVSHCEGTAVFAVCGAVFEPASCYLIRTAVHGAVVECVSVVPEVCSTLHGGLSVLLLVSQLPLT
jgi:hypothetical protein